MSEDRIKWFKKCIKEDKVLDFPLMSESERQVAEGEIVLGKIYFKDNTWYLPEETSDGATFGGPFLMSDRRSDRKFVKYTGGKNSFEFNSKKPEEIPKDHKDYNWIKYCFDNETNISKEEWEKLMSPKVEIGKVYEVTYNSGTKCIVSVNSSNDQYFHGDYFNPSSDHVFDGAWYYNQVTAKLVEDQEYWLANFKNKEIKYRYANVVYDLESMSYNPENHLFGMFTWSDTPQGDIYWREICDRGQTKESKYYLAQMKAQYEKSQQDQSPQETRNWLGEDLTIDQLLDKLDRDSVAYLDIISEGGHEIARLRQEINDLNNKLSESKIIRWIRKII